MKSSVKIVLSTLVWVGILFYLVAAPRLGRRDRDSVTVQKLEVSVTDSAEVDIVRPAAVEGWILDAGLWPVGLRIDDIDTRAISDLLSSRDFVHSAKTYVSLDGTVSVSLAQQVPVVRVITSAGYNFYVTGDGSIVPAGSHSAHYVPVVTGDFGLPFDKGFSGKLSDVGGGEKKEDKNYIFLSKLISFVEYIGRSGFWSSQIVQINVTEAPGSRRTGEPEVEIIPRVGDHVALLGPLDDYEDKLARLRKFYTGALNREGWDKWNHINLKYGNQVVCSNR